MRPKRIIRQVVLIGEDQVAVIEERIRVLIGRTFRSARGRLRPIVDSPRREVPDDPADLAGVEVPLLDGRKLRPGKPANGRSLETLVGHDRHLGVG